LFVALPLTIFATPAPAGAAVLGDDYPASLANAPKDSLVDPWGFYNRECTSFVAWRLNSANHVDFRDLYGGVQWGNAENWGPAAARLGIPVNSTPAVGAVAWDAAGVGGAEAEGHVSWVANIESNGTIDVEEFNYTQAGEYDVRTGLSPSSFSGFIHIADVPLRAPATQAAPVYPGIHWFGVVVAVAGIITIAQAHGSLVDQGSPVAASGRPDAGRVASALPGRGVGRAWPMYR